MAKRKSTIRSKQESLSSMKVEDMGFSRRVVNTLRRNSIKTAADLLCMTKADLLSVCGLGVGSLKEIESKLAPLKEDSE